MSDDDEALFEQITTDFCSTNNYGLQSSVERHRYKGTTSQEGVNGLVKRVSTDQTRITEFLSECKNQSTHPLTQTSRSQSRDQLDLTIWSRRG